MTSHETTVDGFSPPPLPVDAGRQQGAGTARHKGRTAGQSPRLVLAELNGVRDADTLQRPPIGSSSERTMPRFGFSSRSIGAIVFVLLLAVIASLTLLVIQSRNFDAYAAGLEQEVAKTAKSSHSSGATPQTSESDAGSSKDSAGNEADNSAGDGADNGTDSDVDTSGSTQTEDGKESKNSSEPSQVQSPQDTRIDINSATAAQLDTVKGIGPVTAQKIIDYRSLNGRFASVDELMNVSGIGPKTLEKMRSMLVVR